MAINREEIFAALSDPNLAASTAQERDLLESLALPAYDKGALALLPRPGPPELELDLVGVSEHQGRAGT